MKFQPLSRSYDYVDENKEDEMTNRPKLISAGRILEQHFLFSFDRPLLLLLHHGHRQYEVLLFVDGERANRQLFALAFDGEKCIE